MRGKASIQSNLSKGRRKMKLRNEVNGEINGEIKLVELPREEEQAAADSRSKKANRRKKKGRRIERVRRMGKIERVEILRRDAVEESGEDLRAAVELELELEMVSRLMPVVEI